jgi:antitoxin (DNA-binding transcriptional repressor) of toxin-antitoxin stability system
MTFAFDSPRKRPNKDAMKTLTVTEARKNLSGWIRRAGAGEEIAIVDGARLYAIRPVTVMAADYALSEYGATPAEVDAAVARSKREIVAERATGLLTPVFPDAHSSDAPRRRANRRTSGKHAR